MMTSTEFFRVLTSYQHKIGLMFDKQDIDMIIRIIPICFSVGIVPYRKKFRLYSFLKKCNSVSPTEENRVEEK
jgi:hypothetical protein